MAEKSTRQRSILRYRPTPYLEKFTQDPQNSVLCNHGLSRKWKGHFSIYVTGDTKAVYFVVEDSLVRFIAIGSLSKLYG